MAAYNCELRKNTGSAFADILYLKTIPAMVDGLLVEGKLNSALFPAWLFGAPRRISGASGTPLDLVNLVSTLDTIVNSSGGNTVGCYFVITQSSSFTNQSGTGYSYQMSTEVPPEDGVTLEQGDFLFVDADYDDNGTRVVIFSVLNNEYRLASGTVHGLMSSAHYTKLEGIAANANNYSHPTQTAIDANATDNGINVIDRVVVNTLGHVTQVVTRDLAAATTTTPGHMTAAQATKLAGLSNYSHPTEGANVVIDAGTNETIDSVTVDIQGHVTAFTKQTIRSASTSQTGLVELATIEEMKAGTSATLVGAAASVKAAIDFFATLPVYASLTAANTDAPNQPTGKLALVIV